MVEGLPYVEQEGFGNPYTNLEQSRFKTTEDIEEASRRVMPLISGIMNRYHNAPDVMMKKIQALKQNQYNTVPNPETSAPSFAKFYTFLQKELGPEAAQAYIQDYFRHKAINQAKAGMIP